MRRMAGIKVSELANPDFHSANEGECKCPGRANCRCAYRDGCLVVRRPEPRRAAANPPRLFVSPDPSSDDFGKYTSRELIGDSFLAAFPFEHQVAMVHAEKMKHRGVEVMHAHLVFGGAVSDFIGRTVCGAALDPAACHPDAEARRAVVASGGGPRRLRDRQPAELTSPQH